MSILSEFGWSKVGFGALHLTSPHNFMQLNLLFMVHNTFIILGKVCFFVSLNLFTIDLGMSFVISDSDQSVFFEGKSVLKALLVVDMGGPSNICLGLTRYFPSILSDYYFVSSSMCGTNFRHQQLGTLSDPLSHEGQNVMRRIIWTEIKQKVFIMRNFSDFFGSLGYAGEDR